MDRLQIKILNEKHSNVAQELLFSYGYVWQGVPNKKLKIVGEYIYINHINNSLINGMLRGGVNRSEHRTIRLKELKEMLEKDLIK